MITAKSRLAATLFTLTLSPAIAQIETLKATADVSKVYAWNVEKNDKSSTMSVDVPYTKTLNGSEEHLLISVRKPENQKRPDLISIALPDNISGIFMRFAKSLSADGEVQMDESDPQRLKPNCDQGTCHIRIEGAYLPDNKEGTEDVFSKFMNFDHVFFLLMYPDGTHKSVSLPLASFKKQYKAIDGPGRGKR